VSAETNENEVFSFGHAEPNPIFTAAKIGKMNAEADEKTRIEICILS
jgi:hypothetical protein